MLNDPPSKARIIRLLKLIKRHDRKPKTVNHDERMDVRLPSALKEWAMANGGSELIRRLLEAERKRVTE